MSCRGSLFLRQAEAALKIFAVCITTILLGLASAAAAEDASRPPTTLIELRQRIAERIAQPKYDAALWGVKVLSLDTGKTLFEHNPQKLFSPASNSKLYTIALALDRLGEDYRLKTSLYTQTKPSRDTLNGDLIVYGRGDPTINARLHGGDIFKALEPLVTVLTDAGIKRIRGDLIADASFFQGSEFGSGWVWDDMGNYYGAEISALTINDNTLQASIKPAERLGEPCRITVSPATSYLVFSNRTQTIASSSRRTIAFHRPLEENVVYVSGEIPLDDSGFTEDVTVHNPAGLFASLFKEALTRQGIKLKGKLRTVNSSSGQMPTNDCRKGIEVGAMDSPPLRDLAREVEKPSQNLYTDLLLAHVGESSRSTNTPPKATSEELGIAELKTFLAKAGVSNQEVFFEEGSGLSRNNLTTPNATVTLLQYMSRHKCSAAYLDALPIAGVDGTLRNRMKGTAAAGNVRAKTGTLRWANSLSGYVTTAAGEHLVFSLMLNRYHGSSGRSDLDTIAIMLAEFTGKSGDGS